MQNKDTGDLPLVCSAYKTDRQWAKISKLNNHIGENVWLRARVATLRNKSKISFVVLRQTIHTVQAVTLNMELVKYIEQITSESIVDVFGKVTKTQNKISGCTEQNIEIFMEKIFTVSKAKELPFQLSDAGRHDQLDKGQNDDTKEDTISVRVLQNTRLDNRWIDLRTPGSNGIFRIQSKICKYFRRYFDNLDFTEIHTPKIISGVSEGGSEVFTLDYFGTKCCLAQSPQLYKQMAIMSDLNKVYEIGPVFRAENSQSHRHMCEFTGLDFEMEIKEHYHEILKVLGDLFIYIFDNLNANCTEELEAVNKQFPFEPLQYLKETLVLDFKTAHKMLTDAGENIDIYKDPNMRQEKLLGKLVKEQYKTDFFIVDKYPAKVRPFYTMQCPIDPNYTNSYDVFLRGEEITSGAQRVHDTELLKKRAEECKIPLDSIASYINSFQHGAQPHGGAGIGLERVVMLFLGLNNIRKCSMFPRVPNRTTP